jgi:FixJ family two-component response regulator
VSPQARTVHVIDDDAAWRTSVQRLLSAAGYRVVLHDSADVFLPVAEVAEPGCILLDVCMPGIDGLELQRRVVSLRYRLPIVFISGHGDVPTSVRAMKSGAEDFLTKPVPTEVLLDAVARAMARGREDRLEREELDAWRARFDSLTATERKVVALVVTGKLNKQIAAELGTAERTIKWHRHNIMAKLQLTSLAELVLIAGWLGLVGRRDLGT